MPAHGGANVEYCLRKGRLTRCRNGLEKRALDDLAIRVVGSPPRCIAAGDAVRPRPLRSSPTTQPEVEILVLPGKGRFSGRADCNVLVALDPAAATSPAARQAHLTIRPTDADDLSAALAAVA